jgi:hypothetical protein
MAKVGVMKWFLWPGNRLCDLLGLTDADDRQAFRLFSNMIFWSLIIVVAALGLGMAGV